MCLSSLTSRCLFFTLGITFSFYIAQSHQDLHTENSVLLNLWCQHAEFDHFFKSSIPANPVPYEQHHLFPLAADDIDWSFWTTHRAAVVSVNLHWVTWEDTSLDIYLFHRLSCGSVFLEAFLSNGFGFLYPGTFHKQCLFSRAPFLLSQQKILISP